MRTALLAALLAAALVHPATAPATPLTLDAALQRVADSHPELRLFDAREAALQAARERAAQRPPITLDTSLENIAGTGDARSLSGAELTMSLASMFERGEKREARVALAERRLDALSTESRIRRLDLIAEAAHRYLQVVAAGWRGAIAQNDAQQRASARDAARRKFQAGAAPESAALSAEAALARAQATQSRTRLSQHSALRYLTALWGENDPDYDATETLPTLPALEPAESLLDRLEQTPDLLHLIDTQRVAESRLRLAQADARTDISWQAGIRRLQENRDTALVTGLSIPLGNARRAAPAIREAQAESDLARIEGEAARLALRATLIEAIGRYALAREEITQINDALLPRLDKAAMTAERAYRAGAGDYLEWAQLQSEATDARAARVEATVTGLEALIEIQRLTGLPIHFSDTDPRS